MFQVLDYFSNYHKIHQPRQNIKFTGHFTTAGKLGNTIILTKFDNLKRHVLDLPQFLTFFFQLLFHRVSKLKPFQILPWILLSYLNSSTVEFQNVNNRRVFYPMWISLQKSEWNFQKSADSLMDLAWIWTSDFLNCTGFLGDFLAKCTGCLDCNAPLSAW